MVAGRSVGTSSNQSIRASTAISAAQATASHSFSTLYHTAIPASTAGQRMATWAANSQPADARRLSRTGTTAASQAPPHTNINCPRLNFQNGSSRQAIAISAKPNVAAPEREVHRAGHAEPHMAAYPPSE